MKTSTGGTKSTQNKLLRWEIALNYITFSGYITLNVGFLIFQLCQIETVEVYLLGKLFLLVTLLNVCISCFEQLRYNYFPWKKAFPNRCSSWSTGVHPMPWLLSTEFVTPFALPLCNGSLQCWESWCSSYLLGEVLLKQKQLELALDSQ